MVLAMMKRLEQLESNHGIIEMYELLVRNKTLLNGSKKAELELQRKTNFDSQGSFKNAFFIK